MRSKKRIFVHEPTVGDLQFHVDLTYFYNIIRCRFNITLCRFNIPNSINLIYRYDDN